MSEATEQTVPAPVENYAARALRLVAEEIAAIGRECDLQLLRLYTLLVLVFSHRNVPIRPIDVHDAWAMWRIDTRPEHADLIPFAELAKEVADRDAPFALALRRAARRLVCGDW